MMRWPKWVNISGIFAEVSAFLVCHNWPWSSSQSCRLNQVLWKVHPVVRRSPFGLEMTCLTSYLPFSCTEEEKQSNKLPATYCQQLLITSANFRPGNPVDNVISETWEASFGCAVCTRSVSGVLLLLLAATFCLLSSPPRTNYLKLMKVDF